MPFTEQQLAGVVADQLKQAKVHARSAGLIIGENHTQSYARGLIGNLINSGAVKHLCFETSDISQQFAFEGKPLVTTDKEKLLGHWLRKRAAEKADLRLDENWNRFKKSLAPGIFKFDNKEKEFATTVNLLEFAVRNGVDVHLIDINFTEHAVHKIVLPSLKARNQYMAANLAELKKSNGDTLAQCVALVGDSHVSDDRKLDFESLQMDVIHATLKGDKPVEKTLE